MPSFSQRSLAHLGSCDPRLQKLFKRVIQDWDCTVLQGHRDREDQEEAHRSGRSNLDWPESKHNATPSKAADVLPYPINWNDRERIALFAGFVLGTAKQMGLDVRWGGDWDRDRETRDERFFDGPHFELMGE